MQIKTQSQGKSGNESCYALKKMCGFGLVCWYSIRQTPLYGILFFQKKEHKKLTRKLKRQFENAILDRIENLSDKNPKIKLHQSSAKTNETQASEWFDYFENLNGIHLKTDKDSHEARIITDYDRWAIPKNDTLDRPITPQEISTQSKKLKNKKATANDTLSNEIIKLAVKTLPSYFTSLFNTILSQGKFPLFMD